MASFPLNDGQSRAASTVEGAVLVSAGAGTGKTRMLAERFVNAVAPGRVSDWEPARVDEVVTITFTEKAAGEIALRVRASLQAAGLFGSARELDRAWISTIHGFCARVLRAYPLEAGVDPGFQVVDPTHASEIRAEAFDRAARSRCSESREVRDVLALYGFQEVWRAVSRVTDGLEAHGLPSDSVLAPVVPDVRELLAEACTLFSQTEEALRPHAARHSGAANHACSCRGALEMLESAERDGLDDAEVATRLWKSLAEYAAKGGSAAAIKDVCALLTETRKRLLAETVGVLAAPHVRALIELVAAYREELARAKAAKGLLDYADLQSSVARLLTEQPGVRRALRSEFRLMMVDEFQDTDALQLAIVEAIGDSNLCTVGDERQSIYRFRGADVDVYRSHRQKMLDAGATTAELTGNYRSHRDILAFVNGLFRAEGLFGTDVLRLEACRTEPDPPHLSDEAPRLMFDLVHNTGRSASLAHAAEARALAGRFAQLRERGVDPGGMVVLVRKYAHAEPVARALRAEGFAVSVTGGRRFLKLPEVAMVRALCRVIANPQDDAALVELMLSPMSAVTDDGVWLLRNGGAQGSSRSLWDALNAGDVPLGPDDAAAARLMRDVIAGARRRAGTRGLGEVLMTAVEESGADLALLAEGDRGLQAVANVLRFARKADECERSGVAVGAAAFCARIDSEERYGDQETPSAVTEDGVPAVRIMSVHAAKGLEFPVVGLVMLGDGAPREQGVLRTTVHAGGLELALALPAEWGGASESRRTPRFEELRAAAEAAEAAESVRLLYVACTRAEEALVVCGSGNLDREADPGGRSGLDLMRRALAPLFADAVPGMDVERTLADGTRASLRVHEACPQEDSAREAGIDDGQPPVCEPCLPPMAPPAPAEPGREPHVAPARPAHPSPVRPERLSYSDIAAYETCRLRYWAQSVARLGDAALTEEGDPMRFGSALHALFQSRVSGCGRDLERRAAALARYHRLGAGEAERLREAVMRFDDSDLARELAAHGVVRREHPFSVRITSGDHGFFLVGAFDVYARSGADALIVDYKSGSTVEAPSELRARYTRQAECYAYAALREGCQQVTVAFARVEAVSADGGHQSVEFTFGANEARRIEESLAAVYDSIATEPYAPRAARDSDACRGCRAAGVLCPLTSGRVAG